MTPAANAPQSRIKPSVLFVLAALPLLALLAFAPQAIGLFARFPIPGFNGQITFLAALFSSMGLASLASNLLAVFYPTTPTATGVSPS